MASPTETDKIRGRYLFQMWDHDPAVNTAILVSPDGGTTVRSIDMRDHSDFGVLVFTTVLGGNGPVKVEIVAADNAALSTNLVVIKDSGTIAPAAFADWVMETCTAAEVQQEGADNGTNPRYVGGRITTNNSGDEAVVVYFTIPNRPQLNLTPQATIA